MEDHKNFQFSLEIVNTAYPDFSVKMLCKDENELSLHISQYLHSNSYGILEYLKGTFDFYAINLQTNTKFKVIPFHIIFEPIFQSIE